MAFHTNLVSGVVIIAELVNEELSNLGWGFAILKADLRDSIHESLTGTL